MAAGQPGRTAGRLLGDGPAELASVGPRVGAFLLDQMFGGISLFAVFMVVALVQPLVTGVSDFEALTEAEQEAVALWGFAIWGAAYFIGTWALNAIGGSLGKRIVGLRIVRADLQSPGIGVGLGRTLGAWLSWPAFGLGFLWGTWDERGQTWHDKMASTYVVRADSLPRPVHTLPPTASS